MQAPGARHEIFEKFRPGQVFKISSKFGPVIFLESRQLLKKFAGITSGDLRAGLPETTQNSEKKNWPGFARNPPPQISAKFCGLPGRAKRRELWRRKDRDKHTIRPEYRCNGLPTHGKCDLEAVPVYRRTNIYIYIYIFKAWKKKNKKNQITFFIFLPIPIKTIYNILDLFTFKHKIKCIIQYTLIILKFNY